MESSSATSHFTIRRSAISETRSNHRCLLPGFVKFRKNFAAERRAVSIKSCMDSSLDGLRIEPYGFRGRDGIIIVDHGSRRKESNLMLNDFVAMFKHKTGYPIVEPAHMELAEPSIKDAFSLCVQHGANRVIVSPFFLFPGRHWHQDIPSLTAEAAKEHSDVSYIITAPLGLHELLVDVVNDRVTHCLSHSTGNVEECDVCAGTGKCRFY